MRDYLSMHKWIVLAFAALPAFAQAPALEGDWHGTLSVGAASLRLALHVDKAPDGLYTGKLNSLDQGALLPMDTCTLKGDKVHFEIKQVSGTFDGTLAGDKLKGTWTQGTPLPVEFMRDGKDAAVASPEPPRLTKAMMQFGVPADLRVPVAPTPVMLAGKTQLIYELNIINASDATMMVQRLEVMGDGKTLASFEGSELNGLLDRSVEGPGDERSLAPGTGAAAFLEVAGEGVKELRHRVTVDGVTVEGGVAKVSQVKPPVLGPPLRGDNWLAANGPSNTSIHRRALIAVEGGAHIGQRFAIDWLKVVDGKTHTGDEKDNKNYYAYGSEVLAVADGTVVQVKDGIPENVPGPKSRAVPITLETVAGNHVVVDLGGGRYAFFAHLQPGSPRVKVGDKVKRGQVLGLLGNSGNSTEPHLHFHLSDGISPLGSEGMPYVLESLGAIPAQNAMVKF